MKDTSDEIEVRYRRMLMALSPEERLRRASSMFDASKKLVLASLAGSSDHCAKSTREALFLRFYGPDFPSHIRARILEHLRCLAT